MQQKSNTFRNNYRRRDKRGDPSGWSTVSRRRGNNRYNKHTTPPIKFGSNPPERKRNYNTFDFPKLFSGFVGRDATEKYNIPSGPKWCSIISQNEKNVNDTDSKSNEITESFNGHRLLRRSRKRKCIRNQVPFPNINISYDAWEHVYNRHLLELFNIFVNGIEELDVNEIQNQTNQEEFFKIFSLFIKHCSSGEISPYI